MKILTTYTGDLHTKCIHVSSGSQLDTDAPIDNHGKGETFSPTDLFAASAGSCAITTLAIQTKNENIDFTGTVIETDKIMTKTPPRKVECLKITLNMRTSRDVTDDEKVRYESITKSCPVFLSIHPDVKKDMRIIWP